MECENTPIYIPIAINAWTALSQCYDNFGLVPFYNPIRMSYELMAKEEYHELLRYLYNTIRKGDKE